MSQQSNLGDAARLIRELQRNKGMRHKRVQGEALDPRLATLRAWQVQRLSRTYADLLVSKRYGKACRFFLSDLYAPRDFSQRDYDFQRFYEFTSQFVPQRMLQAATLALQLNAISQELDEQLVAVMVDELGMTDSVTPEMYAEGFRRCNNYDQRMRQLELIVALGESVGRISQIPLIGMVLKLGRGAAHSAGWHELQDFLERGYEAFKTMGPPTHFLHTVRTREKRILDQIFAGAPNPFEVG